MAHPAIPHRSRGPLLLTAIVFLVLAVRQLLFVQHYAVNILYLDAWNLHDTLFQNQSWWASFDQQWGPHRQGVGGWLLRVIANLTGWDSRFDAMAVSWLLIASASVGVYVAWRCGLRGWALAGVPVIYLNARQYAFFIVNSNPSHGALPVLLFGVWAMCWFAKDVVRLPAITLLTIALIFTGFGLFVGIITPLLFGAEMIAAYRSADRRRAAGVAVGLIFLAAAWAVFFHGYAFDQAGPIVLSFARVRDFVFFIGVLFSNAAGIGSWSGIPGAESIACGLIIFATVLTICLLRGWRSLKAGVVGDRVSVIIFSLAAFSILFAVGSASGRVDAGWKAGLASRYVTLAIPAFLAMVLHTATSHYRVVAQASIVFSCLLALGTGGLYQTDLNTCDHLHDGCLRWAQMYRLTHDETGATQLAHFQVYPTPRLKERLAFLERNRLNFLAPVAR